MHAKTHTLTVAEVLIRLHHKSAWALAHEIGVDPSKFSAICRGRSTFPNPEAVAKIEAFFGRSLDVLSAEAIVLIRPRADRKTIAKVLTRQRAQVRPSRVGAAKKLGRPLKAAAENGSASALETVAAHDRS